MLIIYGSLKLGSVKTFLPIFKNVHLTVTKIQWLSKNYQWWLLMTILLLHIEWERSSLTVAAHLCPIPKGTLTHLSHSHTETRDTTKRVFLRKVKSLWSTLITQLALNIWLATKRHELAVKIKIYFMIVPHYNDAQVK